MKGERALLGSGGFLLLIGLFMVLAIEATGIEESPVEDAKARADIVVIDTLAQFNDLELPPVTFLHDLHTEALKDKDKVCLTCHKEDEAAGRLSTLFMRQENSGAEAVKTVYHDECITCHTERSGLGVSAGPLEGECRDCHDAEPAVVSNRQDAGFEKILHTRHFASDNIPDLAATLGAEPENCGRCHHEYDKAKGEVVPVQEDEGTCRYCHKGETYRLEEGSEVMVRTLQSAAHAQCIDCHRDLRLEGKNEKGPEKCSSCHGIVGQEQVRTNNSKYLKKVGELPRLEAGQPDAAMVTAFPADVRVKPYEDGGPLTMLSVPFNHKAHESDSDTCRVCHHEAMDSCVSCHSLEGKEEGGFVQLSQAMHRPGAGRSCVGCHAQKQQDPDCSGCHASMDNSLSVSREACAKCHQKGAQENIDVRGLTTEQRNELAATMLEGRTLEAGLYPVEDIPENVEIKEMADEYKAARFPHRRILLTMVETMKDDDMAGYFHSRQGTLCQGCHHNSPVSATPPKCVSCHGKPFDDKNLDARPGLKAAYHAQCMDCHSRMGIEGREITKGKPVPRNTDCTGCHAKKNK
jgi:nitrate/TMAO reductase-like tetraheme cytochrome c subunit